jgi:hypothetical protein
VATWPTAPLIQLVVMSQRSLQTRASSLPQAPSVVLFETSFLERQSSLQLECVLNKFLECNLFKGPHS